MPEEPKSFSSLSDLVRCVYGPEVKEEKVNKEVLCVEERMVYFNEKGERIAFPLKEGYFCPGCELFYAGKPRGEGEERKKSPEEESKTSKKRKDFFKKWGVFETIEEERLVELFGKQKAAENPSVENPYYCRKCGEEVEYPIKERIKVAEKQI